MRVLTADPFVALYEERYAPMVRLAYLLTGDGAAAEELVQDAFVAVHGRWDRVEVPAAYLRTAVVNACRSWGRRRVLERARRPAPAEPYALVADELWDALGRLGFGVVEADAPHLLTVVLEAADGSVSVAQQDLATAAGR